MFLWALDGGMRDLCSIAFLHTGYYFCSHCCPFIHPCPAIHPSIHPTNHFLQRSHQHSWIKLSFWRLRILILKKGSWHFCLFNNSYKAKNISLELFPDWNTLQVKCSVENMEGVSQECETEKCPVENSRQGTGLRLGLGWLFGGSLNA